MDSERKLQILEAADLSEWRKWLRAKQEGKDPTKAEVHGFANILFGMGDAVSYLADGYESKEILELLLYGCQCLTEDYATIPFDEMDPQDPDFGFLFEYRAKLGELKEKVQDFATRVRENGMKASRDWSEYQELDKMIGQLLPMRTSYRLQVLDKYGIS
jgi:hypothetical protein